MGPHRHQDDEANPLVGAEGRAELLRSLGAALELHPEFFSSALTAGGATTEAAAADDASAVVVVYRPGYLVDYLFGQADPATKEVRGWLICCVVGMPGLDLT